MAGEDSIKRLRLSGSAETGATGGQPLSCVMCASPDFVDSIIRQIEPTEANFKRMRLQLELVCRCWYHATRLVRGDTKWYGPFTSRAMTWMRESCMDSGWAELLHSIAEYRSCDEVLEAGLSRLFDTLTTQVQHAVINEGRAFGVLRDLMREFPYCGDEVALKLCVKILAWLTSHREYRTRRVYAQQAWDSYVVEAVASAMTRKPHRFRVHAHGLEVLVQCTDRAIFMTNDTVEPGTPRCKSVLDALVAALRAVRPGSMRATYHITVYSPTQLRTVVGIRANAMMLAAQLFEPVDKDNRWSPNDSIPLRPSAMHTSFVRAGGVKLVEIAMREPPPPDGDASPTERRRARRNFELLQHYACLVLAQLAGLRNKYMIRDIVAGDGTHSALDRLVDVLVHHGTGDELTLAQETSCTALNFLCWDDPLVQQRLVDALCIPVLELATANVSRPEHDPLKLMRTLVARALLALALAPRSLAGACTRARALSH